MPTVPEPAYACKKCKDTGAIVYLAEDGHERCVECTCTLRQRQELILAKAGFDVMTAPSLVDYQPWNDAAMVAKYKAGEFVRNFDSLYQNWFVIYGQSGSGKTMLGRAIVKALVERRKPIRAKAVKYYEMMQRLKSKSNDERYGAILDEYTDCELLFIDDLLKEKAKGGELTEADTKHLFAVIDTRYEKRLPTIITTECTSGRIAELDEAIYWRMSEMAFAEIVFEGKECNYRKRI
jgi:DNA replication protein DnaC